MRRLVLVRHGETAWNAERMLQGCEDVSLSPNGRLQAANIAPLVQKFAPALAIASDLRRSRETAVILGFPKASPSADWREADLGSWQGLRQSELDPTRYQAWRDGRYDPPGGEGWESFRSRVAGALRTLPQDGTTLAVTHGGVIRAALSILIELHPDRIIPVDPGSVTVLDLNGSARLKAFNLTSSVLSVASSE